MPADSVPLPRCGVLGSPIAHSLSPVLHRAAYASLGLDWEYDAYDVDRSGLEAFVGALGPQWRGLSLTMPLKRDVIAICDEVEPLAATLESVNTVVIDPDGRRSGYNTDVVGFVAALAAVGVRQLDRVTVVGGGATAASALAAVARLGASRATVVVRSVERAAPLRGLDSALGIRVDLVPLGTDAARALSASDLLVSTIPPEAEHDLVALLVGLAPVIFEVIYHPAVTPLVAAATDVGATVVAGFDLLLHQAARQVELMTGAPVAPVDAMREAGLAALGNR